ncbi:MAG: prepilin-type N-terminal cleavage/methylation domain-containing protein [Polyangiaceae bacterium]
MALKRALTLLEVLVAIGVLAMISLLLYGAFDGLSRSRSSLSRLQDRASSRVSAIRRIAQEMSSAF